MNQTTTRSTHWPVLAVLLALLALTAGCDKVATQSPPEQSDRMMKASGVAEFHIICPERLWERTNDSQRTGKNYEDLKEVEPIPIEGEDGERGLVEIRLNGPQLVQYLQHLDYNAHPGSWNRNPDPLSVRMYQALAPVVDAIDPAATAAEIPVATVDDTVGVPATDEDDDA